MTFNNKEKEVDKLIEKATKRTEPYDTFSFLQGFKDACELFGVWKDGEQYLGSGNFTVNDIKSGIERYGSYERID